MGGVPIGTFSGRWLNEKHPKHPDELSFNFKRKFLASGKSFVN